MDFIELLTHPVELRTDLWANENGVFPLQDSRIASHIKLVQVGISEIFKGCRKNVHDANHLSQVIIKGLFLIIAVIFILGINLLIVFNFLSYFWNFGDQLFELCNILDYLRWYNSFSNCSYYFIKVFFGYFKLLVISLYLLLVQFWIITLDYHFH